MLFFWLSLAIVVGALAGFVEILAQEVKEEHDEEVGFSAHAKQEKAAEEAAILDKKKRTNKRKKTSTKK